MTNRHNCYISISNLSVSVTEIFGNIMTPAFVVATYRRFALQSVGCGPKGGIAPDLLLIKQEK